MGTFFFTTLFLQDVLGYTPLQTGLGFLPLTAALFLASQLSARRFVEQFGPRRVMVAGTLLSTVALALLSRVSETSSYWSILLPLVLLGLGNGTAFVPLTGASLHEVEPQHAGAASGLVNVTQQVGGSLGLALLVTVFGTAIPPRGGRAHARPDRRRAGAPRLRRRRALGADRGGGLRAPDGAGRLAAAPVTAGEQGRPGSDHRRGVAPPLGRGWNRPLGRVLTPTPLRSGGQ